MSNRAAAVKNLFRVSGALALIGALLAISPAAQARSEANPVLTVTFTISGQISFTAPDGTPLGTSSGTPTQIPAGYYTVQMNGPGGCSNIPYFDMNGPGVNVAENLLEGELASDQLNTYLAPNSTYTWHNVDTVPDDLHVPDLVDDRRRAAGARQGRRGSRPRTTAPRSR